MFYAQEAAKTAQNFDLKVTQSSLRQKIDLGHFEDIQASIHRDFEHLRMNSMSCDYLAVQAYMLQYILAFVTACKEYEIPMQDVFQTAQNPFDKLSNLPTLSDMERWLICSCDQLRKFIRTEEMDRTGNIAQEIRAYLRAHLDQCITLNTLAKRYCYSTNYLGQMFKRHTGQSVGEYLTQVRIERAKELLATTTKPFSRLRLNAAYPTNRILRAYFESIQGFPQAVIGRETHRHNARPLIFSKGSIVFYRSKGKSVVYLERMARQSAHIENRVCFNIHVCV